MTTSTSNPLGTVTHDGATVVLTYDRPLAHPPERVWRALTESEHLHDWFPADIVGERAKGAHVTLPFWPEADQQPEDTPTLEGEILEWDPPRTFAFMWDSERIHFELTPTDEGTRLVTTVHVVDPAERGWPSNAAGYHMCLDALAASLDGRRIEIFEQVGIPELEAAYTERC
ncbi:SRPBCC family protein [Janibacter indicus]|uniref:Uncharacterized conserved protein YndB, AHSA1/START domain n=1 Tax=Janibacter indicus TaxID=857417 RepID=A0A1W1YKQ1_9MICO|nr:SRPBCC family protein [Janibacter indicus]SMC36706.1 Uncharacterized conserved protein YndB, AHSA1/START domain [Janibacter indicus]